MSYRFSVIHCVIGLWYDLEVVVKRVVQDHWKCYHSNGKVGYCFVFIFYGRPKCGHILHSFWDIARYRLKIANFSTPAAFNVSCEWVPHRYVTVMFGTAKKQTGVPNRWWNRFVDMSICFVRIPACDRQTDEWMDILLQRSPHYAWHRAVKTWPRIRNLARITTTT